MAFWLELVISLLIVVGGCFVIVGSVGLVKLPDLMSRLHAPTKATTLGVGGALVASMLYFWGIESKISIHEVLITAFLFITAPVTAHFVAKAYLHQHPEKKPELPPTGRPYGWSTYDAPPDGAAGQAADGEVDRKD
ncbi:Na+/H+ antiporter subunit G [Ectothiorhodospira sp. PHS-1]|uniref:Na+/H+ antiporter subunit G n=1 Tax=Ectothiorhodospira sp. PHS-1 TaxID=519989 RepID=UPI0002EC2F2B|nr:Na+/H+ antiporter subunit G [Ectothiorhodospira sp. PHS-1]